MPEKKTARPADPAPVPSPPGRSGLAMKSGGVGWRSPTNTMDRHGDHAPVTGADASHGRCRPQSTGLLWPAGATGAIASRADVAALCRRASGECRHHRISGMVLCTARRPRLHGLALDLGQRLVAPQPGRAALAAPAQSTGQARCAGARIVVCPLPSKSPWLNPIEPKWVHGKRAVAEPDRLLSAAELEARVYAYYGCKVKHIWSCPKRLPDYALGPADAMVRP